jgi:hypothetical protein
MNCAPASADLIRQIVTHAGCWNAGIPGRLTLSATTPLGNDGGIWQRLGSTEGLAVQSFAWRVVGLPYDANKDPTICNRLRFNRSFVSDACSALESLAAFYRR